MMLMLFFNQEKGIRNWQERKTVPIKHSTKKKGESKNAFIYNRMNIHIEEKTAPTYLLQCILGLKKNIYCLSL